MTGIGPRFGADRDHARKFHTRQDALAEQGKHWSFESTEVVDVKQLEDERPENAFD